MTFTHFKMGVIAITGLDKDALHIYVGVGVFLLCVFVLRPLIKPQRIRTLIAIIVVTCIALLGEYLDNYHTITALGFSSLSGKQIADSIHDLINTCLLPYVLFALMRWTSIFHPAIPSKKLLRRR